MDTVGYFQIIFSRMDLAANGLNMTSTRPVLHNSFVVLREEYFLVIICPW